MEVESVLLANRGELRDNQAQVREIRLTLQIPHAALHSSEVDET